MTNCDVLISNGFNRFHMSVAATEMECRGRLVTMLTGCYPTPATKALIDTLGLKKLPRVRRLLDREENIPPSRITAISIPELIHNFGKFTSPLDRYSYHQYAQASVAKVRLAHAQGAKLYHYRAGFGHASVPIAKHLGMVTLCDHSIAHPALIQKLVENDGKLPPKDLCYPGNAFWTDILADIKQADHVLVNSMFVADGFAYMGWPDSKISVIYLGVDQKFLNEIPRRSVVNEDRPLRFLFAGSFGRRKGAHILLSALQQLKNENWELHIAGPIESEVLSQFQQVSSSNQGKVKHLGMLHRRDLAKAMVESDVFVFPSLAEGSARAIFEALACGLPVITTPNAGSIVEDCKHGWLIAPGDTQALVIALNTALDCRSGLAGIGTANAKLIGGNFIQIHYGDCLEVLYDRLLGTFK